MRSLRTTACGRNAESLYAAIRQLELEHVPRSGQFDRQRMAVQPVDDPGAGMPEHSTPRGT